MEWTEQAVAHLRERAAEDASYGVIAMELGCTRNMVIGNAKRLKLPGRQRQAKTRITRRAGQDGGLASRLKVRLARPPKLSASPVNCQPVAIPEPQSRNLSLIDLTDQTCKWAHGTDPYSFCGHETWRGLAYCEHHARRVYKPECFA